MSRPHITLGQIRERSAPKTYARGESLYLNKAISETVLRGNVIEGVCEASSQDEPYQVQATITDEGIIDSSCNCLYDFGGDCKHVTALLLTYLNDPKRFEERAPLADVLESREKSELITLIRQMVKRHPDLKTLIDRPVPSKKTSTGIVDVTPYRKELRQALRKQRRDWGEPSAETAVASISDAAGDFAEADDWRNASIILRMVVEEILAKVDYFYDDESGELGYVLDQVFVNMGECLERLANNDIERKSLLHSLMDFYLTDIESGGDVGSEIPDIVTHYARKNDIADLSVRLTNAIAKITGKPYSEWTIESYKRFLIELDLLDDANPEAAFTRLREQKMYGLLFSKLIERKRVDEAMAVARENMPDSFERKRVLTYLLTAGYRKEAINLAEETVKEHYDQDLADWLIYNLQMEGDIEGVLRWQMEKLKVRPNFTHYMALKESAEKLGNWASIRPAIIEQLESAKNYGVLTRICLADEDWDKAWKLLPKVLEDKDLMYTSNHRLEMDVAEATIQTHPEKALPVYIRYIRTAINKRNREHYQDAARHLAEVRDAYDSMDEFEVWEKLITGIRKEFPRLSALQEELKKAGL